MITWERFENYDIGQTENFELKNKIAIFCDMNNTINLEDHTIIYYLDNIDEKDVEIIVKNASVKIFNVKKFCKYSKPFDTFIVDFFQNMKIENMLLYGETELDYKFALNCGIKFICKNTPQINYPIDFTKKNQDLNFEIEPKQKDMIILVGYQGCGKSTYANYMKEKYNYYVLSIDDYVLKNNILLLSKIEEIIKNNSKIIIDYFCLKPIRKKFINFGKKYEFYIRIAKFDCDINFAKHNSYYRYLKENREIANLFFETKLDLNCDLSENIDEIITIKDFFHNADKKYYKYMF